MACEDLALQRYGSDKQMSSARSSPRVDNPFELLCTPTAIRAWSLSSPCRACVAHIAAGLIKALRASKHAEDAVIRQALQDIAIEVKSPEWDIKAGAVLKLTYLEMLGSSHLAQHSFPVIECMSSPRLHIKQIGYLAASQSFVEDTEVILLTNNLIKKDLSTAAATPAALLLTLSSLPPLLNSSPQLCEDLDPELQRQLTHSRPQVRSSAVLVMGSVWKRTYPHNPDGAAAIINKLADRLVDEDSSVVCSAVNVMLEMARCCQTDDQKAPFLRLAPECFELLTSSTNNWMLIKVIKLVRDTALSASR
jgi:AP-3 complex subunit delta-1